MEDADDGILGAKTRETALKIMNAMTVGDVREEYPTAPLVLVVSYRNLYLSSSASHASCDTPPT